MSTSGPKEEPKSTPEPSGTSNPPILPPTLHYTLVIQLLKDGPPISHSFDIPEGKSPYTYSVDFFFDLTKKAKKLSVLQVVKAAELRDGLGKVMQFYEPKKGWSSPDGTSKAADVGGLGP
jgi:hypothetical protein